MIDLTLRTTKRENMRVAEEGDTKEKTDKEEKMTRTLGLTSTDTIRGHTMIIKSL